MAAARENLRRRSIWGSVAPSFITPAMFMTLSYTAPPARPWNWLREHVRIQRMAYSWINKHPDLASRLPGTLYDEYNRMLRARGAPWLHYDRTRKGWWVRDKAPPRTEAIASAAPAPKRKIRAIPFIAPDEAALPVRSFLFSQHYQRGQCTMTIGTDGAGKST
jgi:hypothetical protein